MRSEGGREARYVGVNVPAAESDPATLDRVGLAASFGSATDLRVSSPDEWHEVIFARRRGRDLTGAQGAGHGH